MRIDKKNKTVWIGSRFFYNPDKEYYYDLKEYAPELKKNEILEEITPNSFKLLSGWTIADMHHIFGASIEMDGDLYTSFCSIGEIHRGVPVYWRDGKWNSIVQNKTDEYLFSIVIKNSGHITFAVKDGDEIMSAYTCSHPFGSVCIPLYTGVKI